MKRYGRRPSHADELRKKNALKFYEPHLSAETRRQLEGHKGPKIEQAEQAMTRVADKMPGVTPEEAAHALGRKISVTMFDDSYLSGISDLPHARVMELADDIYAADITEMPEHDSVVIGWDLAGSGGDHSVIAVRSEDGISCHTINTDRIASDSVITQRTHEAEDFSKWPNLKWRQLEQITPNDGNTVLLWWPPHGPCLGTYFTSYLKPWRVVSWGGETFKASFVELCADGAVFQPIDATS